MSVRLVLEGYKGRTLGRDFRCLAGLKSLTRPTRIIQGGRCLTHIDTEGFDRKLVISTRSQYDLLKN